MKRFKSYLILFITLISFTSAEELPRYRFIDLGLFCTDGSNASAVNEKGQVVGTCQVDQSHFIFLWDKDDGLKIIDNPANGYISSIKLNNHGQIAILTSEGSKQQLFLWDPSMGFWQLETYQANMRLIGLNDKSQVLGEVSNQSYLWDHGMKINLTTLFKEQVQGDWSSIRGSSINNHGHIAFSAHKSQSPGNDSWGTRSFLWSDGSFKMIMPEKSWDTFICDVILDDVGNMIVNSYPRQGGEQTQHFISSSRIVMSCTGCDLLLNGFPVARGCLPGKIKVNKIGHNYVTMGTEIKKLIKEEFSYYNVANTMSVRDQNSKGHVVGTVNTIYPGYGHAFLAIPEH